jgi:molecular chaperone DnaJ
MIEDPYKVLGISRDATKDEIKKAYRKKAKEYHPDLHPNDPEAARKMNEINEAYDMLNNPEKYKREEQRTSSGYQGGYQGAYRDTYRTAYENAQGPGADANDSPEIRQVIELIQRRQFLYANGILNSIAGRDRDAKWYYLSAVANQGLGNILMASEQIDHAIQLDPGNAEYQRMRQQLHHTEDAYNEAGKEFQKYAEGINRFCVGVFATQFLCMFCCH